MVAVDCRLLVHHARRDIFEVQENRTRCIGRTVKQRVEVFRVVLGLHHGIVDVGIRHINPSHDLGICLSKSVKIDNRHAARILIAHVLLLDLLVRIARLLVANLCIDKDGGSGNDQTDAHDDEQNGDDGAAFLTRRLGVAGRSAARLPRRPGLLLCRAI